MKFQKLALALALLQLLVACDSSGARNETLQKAERGDVEAQVRLGRAYNQGEKYLVEGQDYFQSVEWFRKAAEQGHPYALRMLAISYERGEGVSRDYAEAANWYRRAAEQGDIVGKIWLSRAYSTGANGFNEPQDKVLGYAWANLAAKGYDEEAKSLRDRLERELSPAELAEAQRLSSNWQKGRPIQRAEQ